MLNCQRHTAVAVAHSSYGDARFLRSGCGSVAEDEAADAERKAEAERERDQKEKDEFEARLQARDEEKTRRIVEQRIPKEDLEVRCSLLLQGQSLSKSYRRNTTKFNKILSYSSMVVSRRRSLRYDAPFLSPRQFLLL